MLRKKLNKLFASYGYREFKMTKFENYDLYSKYRDFLTTDQIITFNDLDGSLMALKPDITLSIIKNNDGKSEKVFYYENVYRPADHHYREIPQAGVENIGKLDAYQEAEILKMAAEALACTGDDYVIRISDMALLEQMLFDLDIEGELKDEVLRLFALKNADGVRKLVEAGKLSQDSADILFELISLFAPLREGIWKIKPYMMTKECKKVFANLCQIKEILEGFGVVRKIYLDFSLVKGMDYYNGLVFQGAISSIPFSIISGGRYDQLPKKMGKDVGAIGFAVYLDLIDEYLGREKNYAVDYIITYDPLKADRKVSAVVAELKELGKTVLLLDEAGKDQVKELPKAKKIISIDEAKEILEGLK